MCVCASVNRKYFGVFFSSCKLSESGMEPKLIQCTFQQGLYSWGSQECEITWHSFLSACSIARVHFHLPAELWAMSLIWKDVSGGGVREQIVTKLSDFQCPINSSARFPRLWQEWRVQTQRATPFVMHVLCSQACKIFSVLSFCLNVLFEREHRSCNSTIPLSLPGK